MTVTVAIVGRPNVGKSTLFNRLAGRRLAIVDDTPGVTRDRREGEGRLGDLSFRIVDTAGFEDARGDDLAARIQAQTARALSEADVVLFMIDARAGVTPLDHELAQMMRGKPGSVVLIANKCEGRAGQTGLAEAWALGLGQPIPFSAEHAEGIGHLYDALMPFFPEPSAETADQEPDPDGSGEPGATPDRPGDDRRGPQAIQLAVVGRPNVGKSTLINRLIGDDRLVTGPEAGITRNSIGIDWTFRGRTLRLFDTAGLRRRAKIDDRLEELAGADTIRAIRFAHVVVIVIDATIGLEKQDLTIIDLTASEGRAPLLALNKWDLIEDRRAAMTRVRERLETSMPQLRGLRLVPLSALTGNGLDKLLPEVLAVEEAWNRKLGTPRLNRWLAQMTARQAPPSAHGRPVKIRYMLQTKARPPTFVLFANRPEEVPEAYLRYLAGGLREAFDFPGIPLRLSARRSRNPYAT